MVNKLGLLLTSIGTFSCTTTAISLHNASAHINVSATPTSDAANSSSTIGSLGVGSYILQALAESTDTGLTTSTPSTPDPSTVTATDATDTATLAMSASDEPVSVAPLGDPVVMSTDVFTKTVNLHGHPEAVSQAHQCWSDLLTWSSQSYSWYSSNVYNRTFSFTTTTMTPLISTSWTSTFYPSDVSVYTLCDGSPRADIRPWTTSSTYNVTGTPYSYSSLSTPTYTVAQPCIPSEQDCHIWYADSSIPDVNERALENQCGNPAHGPDGDCVFGVEGGVQLIYFPVSTVGGDLCTGNGTTIYPPPRSDGPNVITTLGRTFTSGSAYISIKSLSAWVDGFGYTVGPNFSDLILTVKSEDVSTQCKGNKIGTSMNWADLNWPVPASAYECQDRCGRLQLGTSATPAECSTIWRDFNPLLAIPTAVKDLSPLWSKERGAHQTLHSP